MQKTKIIGILVGLLLVAAGIGALYRMRGTDSDKQKENINPPQSGFQYEGAPAPAAPTSAHQGTQSPPAPDGTSASANTYTNSTYGFSFQKPEGFRISPFSDENGELLNVEKSPTEGFQLYITPFDVEGPLAADFIRSELPGMTMKNVKNATLDSVRAVVFESENESIGPTFEVWFVWPESPIPNGNYLYQITAYKDFAGGLSQILQTWKFQ